MARYFFDAHMHAMNLNHPDFVSLVDSVASGFSEFVVSGALSPGYLLTPANRSQQGLVTILNMFSVFERSIAQMFELIEDDLCGNISRPEEEHKGKRLANIMYPDLPYIRDGAFHFRNQRYDYYALVPLVMDFSRASNEWGKAYYAQRRWEKIIAYLDDTIKAIHQYYELRPAGLLRFFPFLGINSEAHETAFIKELLDTYIRTDRSASDRIPDSTDRRLFWGVKLYPPLGTDPWPADDTKKLEKIETIYRFCSIHKIPITTHCDDQGFRGVTAKLAQQYTSPASWKPVLAKYPDLYIDFAHYGKQYNPLAKPPLKALLDNTITNDPWFGQIIEFMSTYEHVYADVSFTGTDPLFYQQLYEYLEKLDDEYVRERILTRSMFGSDFSVNLSKVESYANYLRIFETSPFPDETIERFAYSNPVDFLGIN
ncbi:MAG: amidohydrolase family protein [Sphaerochaetaceae bacterium]|jgi:predicted TIM-barrel fold metal-dependent hydrolase|nr:amidohydrolase family protein [Sphaerochaetaceae bacterium]